jgi:hypothetical protein
MESQKPLRVTVFCSRPTGLQPPPSAVALKVFPSWSWQQFQSTLAVKQNVSAQHANSIELYLCKNGSKVTSIEDLEEGDELWYSLLTNEPAVIHTPLLPQAPAPPTEPIAPRTRSYTVLSLTQLS